MEDLTEKEQLEALRTWWSENGSYIIGGVIVGVLIIFGWNRWQTGIADAEIAASTLFENVMESSGRGNLDAAAGPAGELFSDYSDSAYAAQARLAMARMYMDSGRDQDAADVLRPLAESSSAGELSLVGRLRLAKILLYQDKAQEVVELVSGNMDTAFASRFNEVLGDAYVALGSYVEAEAAYIAALNDNPSVPTVDVAFIQLKINDLPVAEEVAAVQLEDSTTDEVAADDQVESTVDDVAPDEPPAEASEDDEPESE